MDRGFYGAVSHRYGYGCQCVPYGYRIGEQHPVQVGLRYPDLPAACSASSARSFRNQFIRFWDSAMFRAAARSYRIKRPQPRANVGLMIGINQPLSVWFYANCFTKLATSSGPAGSTTSLASTSVLCFISGPDLRFRSLQVVTPGHVCVSGFTLDTLGDCSSSAEVW